MVKLKGEEVQVLIHSHSDGVSIEVFENVKSAEKALKQLAGKYYERNDICDVGGDGCAWVEYACIR